jgi:hypothetical protein
MKKLIFVVLLVLVNFVAFSQVPHIEETAEHTG